MYVSTREFLHYYLLHNIHITLIPETELPDTDIHTVSYIYIYDKSKVDEIPNISFVISQASLHTYNTSNTVTYCNKILLPVYKEKQ